MHTRENVGHFIANLESKFNITVMSANTPAGLHVRGEYYTHRSQLLTLDIMITPELAVSAVYDSARRRIFSGQTKKPLSSYERLIVFIKDSFSKY